MNIDMLNPYVLKILISARERDSIRSISERMGLSYGWTYKWTQELIKEGIFKETWRGVVLQKNNKTYKEILRFIRANLNAQGFYYSALSLFGVEYCFTKTDAVYFWTEGRYNVARYRDFYPIFIKVKKEDFKIFEWYCKKLKLKTNSKNGVFYSPEIVESVKSVKKGNYFVESLEETIKFMKKNIYNFEPALEMIKEMYNKKVNVAYKEANLL